MAVGAAFEELFHLPRAAAAGRPGARMIGAATVLLFALGAGLLGVSVAAQYQWVLTERHQQWASLVEAVALDLAMLIFSLLALGLARAGLPARTARGLIAASAAGSAVMNYAAADPGSARSVLAYVVPPLLLAVVADQVVVTVRRHVLGMDGGSSWWAAGLGGAGRLLLYLLRFVLDPGNTLTGARRAVLAAAPLPGRAALPPATSRAGGSADPNPGSKTARFLDLVAAEHGPLEAIALDQVSPISRRLAPRVGLDAGAARTALRKALLARQA